VAVLGSEIIHLIEKGRGGRRSGGEERGSDGKWGGRFSAVNYVGKTTSSHRQGEWKQTREREISLPPALSERKRDRARERIFCHPLLSSPLLSS
jgi:hypothetical protein